MKLIKSKALKNIYVNYTGYNSTGYYMYKINYVSDSDSEDTKTKTKDRINSKIFEHIFINDYIVTKYNTTGQRDYGKSFNYLNKNVPKKSFHRFKQDNYNVHVNIEIDLQNESQR